MTPCELGYAIGVVTGAVTVLVCQWILRGGR